MSLLEIWREGGEVSIFFGPWFFSTREGGKELFWDPEKMKGPKDKKRIKSKKIKNVYI